MKIVFITGNHPRHAHIARSIFKTGLLSSIIIEKRENFLPTPPENIDDELKGLFKHHFSERERVEEEFFGDLAWPDCPLYEIEISELNGPVVHNILNSTKPDLLLSYGCHMLNDETLSCVSGEKWNCHGGLSPWYKGAITHFWPSYMLEPQMTGMTVHDLTNQLDAGDVVHQCAADLISGDTIHMLGARAVQKLSEELPILINLFSKKGSFEKKQHNTNGMLWLANRWKPEHLKQIYIQNNDQIVDLYLNGKLSQKPPQLFRQF